MVVTTTHRKESKSISTRLKEMATSEKFTYSPIDTVSPTDMLGTWVRNWPCISFRGVGGYVFGRGGIVFRRVSGYVFLLFRKTVVPTLLKNRGPVPLYTGVTDFTDN